MAQTPPPTVSTISTVGGSTVRTIHVERTLIMVLMQDYEAETLTALNSSATLYIAIATFLYTVVASVTVGIALSSVWNDMTKVLGLVVGPLCLILGIVFTVAAMRNISASGTQLAKIKEQSKPIQQ
jgi:ABC-type polysaccharide/polyol phosphate export permease